MISVVTITRNNHAELLQTLASLKGQVVQSVVINGGSHNETSQFLRSHEGMHVSEPDNGISDAFNKGVKLSTGDYVTFLNSGDRLIDPGYYAEAEHIFKAYPEVDFVYADILFSDSLAGTIRVRSKSKLPDMPYMHPTLIVKKTMFKMIGEFDASFRSAMDLDWIYRMHKAGYIGKHIDRAVVVMDGHGISSLNESLYLKEKFKAVFKNRDYSPRAFISLSRLIVSFNVRKILYLIGLQNVVARYRKKRHQ